MERKVMCGVKIGEHSIDIDSVIKEIEKRVEKTGCNLVYIRVPFREKTSDEMFLDWARVLAEKKIYFHFATYRPPNNLVEQFTPELVAKMKEIAGEFFIGNGISEPGTAAASNFRSYYKPVGYLENMLPTDCKDMQEAHDNYIEMVKNAIDKNRANGMPASINIEATALPKYNLEAGIDFPVLEVMNGNADSFAPIMRGASRGYGKKSWGALIAHEWYGGMRHEDILKRKRLELAYKFIYLSGADTIMMESGDEMIRAYGANYDAPCELCNDYIRTLSETAAFAKEDSRPDGGPKVEFAFVSGRLDAWSGFCGSSVWNQFGRAEWGHGDSEHSWRILGEVGTRRKWSDVTNYGDYDASALPAYGTYDVIPIESDIEILSKYKYLVFVGWNSMTDGDMDKLTEYVNRGGKLLMCAAHLNMNTARDGKLILPDADKIKALFGCSFTGGIHTTNSGTKFRKTSLNGEILYPGSDSELSDPQFSAGYVDYAVTELCGGEAAGRLSDSFWGEGSENVVSVIENRVGDGVATLVTAINYPGYNALYPMYSAMAREFMSASARNCEIRLIGSDRVRYTVYEGDKVYLLNTDYDLPITIKLIKGDSEKTITLDSLELKSVQI